MRRRVRNLLSAASLTPCVATLALWVRSHWVRDILAFGTEGGNGHVAQSILGRVHLLSNPNGGSAGGISHASDRLSPNAAWHGGMSSTTLHPFEAVVAMSPWSVQLPHSGHRASRASR